MPSNDIQKWLGQLTAQKEALQDPSITDELLSRYWTKNPTERKLDELVLTVLGLASGYQGIKAAREAPAAVEEAASSIPEVIQKLIGMAKQNPELRGLGSTRELGKGGETMMEHLPGDKGTSVIPGGQGQTGWYESQSAKYGPTGLTDLYKLRGHRGVPFSQGADLTQSLTDPPLVEPLGRLTSPLKKIAARTLGGRYHGTNIPIPEMKNPLDVPPRNAQSYGRGLYTTNNDVISDEYARIKAGGTSYHMDSYGEPGSVRYHTHQIAPVRWLNIDKPFPKRLIKVMKEDIINKEIEARKPGSQTPIYYGPIDLPQPNETIEGWVRRQEIDVGDSVWGHLQEWAEKEGFGGLKHTGGRMTNGTRHKVKIYWHPEEQVRLRPRKYSLYQGQEGIENFSNEGRSRGAALSPRVSKPSIPAPKPKYVRDPLKTKKLD